MKVSLNWLRELVDLPSSVEQLVELLTMAGVEVEGIETTGCAIPKVVVAQIQESAQHPNADRLSVCKVDDGSGTPRQIVCGAKNYQVGDKVPLALPGATLPGDFTIKAGKLRGVESDGMLCSAKELRIAEDADGLLILPRDARVGAPIGELFPGDIVLELEITPNRPDLLSHAGIAVEIATLTGVPIRKPAGPAEPKVGGDAPVVAVETSSPCCYTARRISGVKVGPGPEWLRTRLESIGLRSINSVVDVTNFVMMASGQPLHAFDAAKVRGTLRVRNARDGEQFLALDGKTYSLASGDLVIADDEKALAIAGVMGGEDSGVTAATTDVLLEVAVFEPASIRRTSRRLGLSSDSSYRFERGVWLGGVDAASLCAAKHIAEVAGASLVSPPGVAGQPEVLAQRMAPRPAIPLRLARVAALLGVELPEERVRQILSGFGCEKTAEGWRPPGYRPDLAREVDLIEEVARVVGMDAVPSRTRARFTASSVTDRAYDRAMAVRRALIAQGLHEARSITLVPAEPLGLKFALGDPAGLLRVKNAMIDDQVVLRPGLMHGLLTALRDNLRAGAKGVRLFEVGRVFSPRRPEEFTHAAVVLTGPVARRDWRGVEERDADLFTLKALASAAFGDAIAFSPAENPSLALSLAVKAGGKPVGIAGQLWPAEARALDAVAPVVFLEVDLAALWKALPPDAARKYREIPRFPSTTRDIAVVAPLALAHESIATVLAAAKEPLLAEAELFDVFTDPTGARVPADKKSLAYSLTYRSAERTLTADEVNAAHSRLKEWLKAELGVVLRE
jgi:phenylalanyl-tRNA synthetase beta chain